MITNLDECIDRRGTQSLKWECEEDDLSMWIADMDFKTAPSVQAALAKKVTSGIFGYQVIPDEYFSSYQMWWKKHHHYEIKKEWMLFSSGVVPAISSIIRKLTTPAEKVVVLAPCYNIFYNSVLNNGRVVNTSNLHYENGRYEIDFADLETKLQDSQTTMMILCNPHNPIGKIWTRSELERIGALCAKYHVLVVSDEVHCDLCIPGKSYTPFASVNHVCEQNSITCLSASKTFNLAGLQAACIVVPNASIRDKVWRGLNTDEVAEPNSFACLATVAAFQGGVDWLIEVRSYIQANRKIAQDFINECLPQLHLVPADATYLLWIAYDGLDPLADLFCTFLQREYHLLLSSGSNFGGNGTGFIRMNIACPKERLLEGLYRLKEGIEAFTRKYLNAC